MSERAVVLEDIAELIRGVSYRLADLLPDVANSVPLLRATNIGNRTLKLTDVLYVPSALVRDSQLLRRFDVVIAMSSGSRLAVGRLAQLRQDWTGCVGAFCAVIRPDPKGVHPEYLGYVLQSPDFRERIETYAVGTAIMNLSRERLFGFPLKLPGLADQRAIAHILGTLDDRIELNRRMNETLEAMARTLFKSWFVDFDPVRAKAEGHDPGLPQPLADLFPDSFEDSKLGEIPAGWEVGTLGDISTLNPEVWSKHTRPPEISYVDLSNTKWGRIESVAVYEQADAPTRAQRVLRSQDTIVGTVRPGNGSYAFVADEGLTGSTGFAVLRPTRPDYAEFVYLAATVRENIEALSHMADGAAYPAVRPEIVAGTQVVTPSTDMFAAISRLTGPLLSQIAASERESRTLAALRDALLPKLISGEVRLARAGVGLAGSPG